MRKVVLEDLPPLTPKEVTFVIEYCKDFSPALAAERSGYSRSYGPHMLEKEHVVQAIETVLAKRMQLSHIDAEWVLSELVDNHVLSRQMGELGASNTALGMVMKHKHVDAIASAKSEVHMTTADDLNNKIQSGRVRAGLIPGDDDRPSFL